MEIRRDDDGFKVRLDDAVGEMAEEEGAHVLQVRLVNETASARNNDWNADYTAEALDVISLKFVHDAEGIDAADKYKPLFANQHFGQDETIYGYKDLSVTLHYTDASFYFYPIISYSTTISAVTNITPVDIIRKLRAQLPSEQMYTMCDNFVDFKKHLEEQKDFRPFGELISVHETGSRIMQLWKVTENNSPLFDAYLVRVQSIALWYIDGAEYTDSSNPRWMHYFMYESIKKSDGNKRFALVGYASIVAFYNYPDMIRPRIAHFLLLPQYRGAGNGVKFLQSIYGDLATMKHVKDISVEEPTDAFQRMRDFVDCCNCSQLPIFEAESLKKGYTSSMANIARESFKLSSKQARRVYEILKLYHTNTNDEKEMKDYCTDVRKRIAAPFKRTAKDLAKLSRVLNKKDYGIVSSQVSLQAQGKEINKMLDELLKAYKKVVERLRNFKERETCLLELRRDDVPRLEQH